MSTCYDNELMKNLLPHLTEQLELCQKSLTAFLDTKRAEFPRFYFVSDPTLLEILSLGSDPQSVTPHFQSGLFDSLTQVTFDKVDKTKMLEMFSQQNECVKFIKVDEYGHMDDAPVLAQGNIEVWLQRLVIWRFASVVIDPRRVRHAQNQLQPRVGPQPATRFHFEKYE